ncbi:hypothetical protein [Priestia megaterium]|uniref:hypothetical protein n=1 Tax=Priestia megaterium TaxID=1404 RepID=UPI002FFD774D
MKNTFVLDLQKYSGVREGLAWILGREYKDFEYLLARYMFYDEGELTLEYIEDKIKIDWGSMDLKNLWIKVYHFTTRANEEEAFVDICNLFYLLSNDTEFREFFKSHGVEFYLDKLQLMANGEVYNFGDVKNSMNEALEWIHTKLYKDSEVWGFVRVLDINEYNTDFPERPEFITNVAELLKDGTLLLDDWNEKYGKPYVIEFKQPFYSIQISSNCMVYKNDFMRKEYLDEEEFEAKQDQYELELKRGLFSLLLAIFMDNVSRYGVSELANNDDEDRKGLFKHREVERLYGGFEQTVCAVAPKNVNIPSSQILKVWEFEDFQKNARKNNGYLN